MTRLISRKFIILLQSYVKELPCVLKKIHKKTTVMESISRKVSFLQLANAL